MLLKTFFREGVHGLHQVAKGVYGTDRHGRITRVHTENLQGFYGTGREAAKSSSTNYKSQ